MCAAAIDRRIAATPSPGHFNDFIPKMSPLRPLHRSSNPEDYSFFWKHARLSPTPSSPSSARAPSSSNKADKTAWRIGKCLKKLLAR